MTIEGIEARPVGRVLRLLTGLLLVIEGGRHLVGASLTLVAPPRVSCWRSFYSTRQCTFSLCVSSLRSTAGPALPWPSHPCSWYMC